MTESLANNAVLLKGFICSSLSVKMRVIVTCRRYDEVSNNLRKVVWLQFIFSINHRLQKFELEDLSLSSCDLG